MAWYQEWFGEEYLELYAHRDEQEAKEQVAFFDATCGRIEGPLLDLACGMGRHVNELKALGHQPIGCDLSLTLLMTGRREYGPMAVARADMRHLPFCDSVFAGLVNFFTSFGYFADEQDDRDVVREMARVLMPGAQFLFDYLNVHRERRNLVEKETKQTPLGEVRIERWFDVRERCFNKRMTIGDRRYLERVRGYELDEIGAMFHDQGMRIERAFGGFDGSPFEDDSPRLILVGRRA